MTERKRADDDEVLQQRLQRLKAEFEAEKISIAPGLKVIESLKAVRYAPDGTIDLSTVDGLVRSMALATAYMYEREDAKNALSLRDIQQAYFDFLSRNFGKYYEVMTARSLTPHDVATAVSKDASSRQKFLTALPELIGTLEQFWAGTADALHAHLEDLGGMKCSYGGDLFPTHNENIASKCGLYADTIILPDPFLRSRQIFANWSEEKSAYYVVKNALNVLQYRELALADVSPPIIAISPDYSELADAEKQFVGKVSEEDALLHASKIFGQEFDSMQSLFDYAGRLGTIDALLPAIKAPKRVLFDMDWGSDPKEQIETMMKRPDAEFFSGKGPGVLVAGSAYGRMAQANDLLIKSRRLGATPIIDAPTSWQYFVWKLEYDAERAKRNAESPRDVHIMRALEALAHSDMEWIGKIPADALVEIRASGALDEIRSIVASGVKEIADARPDSFYRSKDRVFDNLEKALGAHQSKLDALRAKKWKFAGKDIGTWVVSGTVAVAAALTGYPIYALAALAVDQVIDIPKLKDIPKSITDLAKESKELRQSPVGLLFSYRKIAQRS